MPRQQSRKSLDQFATRAIHAGQEPDPSTGAIMMPVYMTSTYVQASPGVIKGPYDYSRSANPTRTALEANLASLEGGAAGFSFSSGLAAMDCMLHLLKSGDHVVLCDDVYGGSFRQIDKVFRHHGLTTTRVDMTDAAATAAAFTDRTRLVWIETPTNPMLKVVDIARVSALARARGRVGGWTWGGKAGAAAAGGAGKDRHIIVAVDNTFATPFLQNPLALGADVVHHSCTKYIGGHSDVVGGALIVGGDSDLAARIKFLQNAVGAIPGPMDCFMLLRSTKTLHLRVARHCENALAVARFLEAHSKVTDVRHPGLASHPQHAIARRQMRRKDGSSGAWGGGMITCQVKGGLAAARRFLERVRLFSLAESLGGVESLIEHPAIMTHASVPPENRRALGISDGLVRLSVGVEDVNDLIEDLRSALR